MFADPSLAIAALGIGKRRLFEDLNTYGFMFENLCLRDLCAYAEYHGGSLYHYRDNSDFEVDAIIEIKDGCWGAFEIKLGESQVEAAAQTLLKNDLFGSGFSKKNTAKLNVLLRSLARNNATTVKENTLMTDVTGDSVALSRNSVMEYITDLKRIFVIEDIPGWNPGIRSKTRIRMSPKIMFADPSLAIAALGIGKRRLFEDLNTYGFMFENLCLRDLCAYAEFHGGSLYHYRDNSDLEVDAIIEIKDGCWGAFEIKLGESQVEAAAQTLLRLKNKLVSNGAKEPSCLAVITGGGLGRKRKDGVYVIPVNALKP